MKISKIGEFGLIDIIKKLGLSKGKDVLAGIGDDTAVIRVPGAKTSLLLTTDTLVEKVHFDLKYSTYYQLGWKLMAVNMSDIAAMGGMPKYALVTLGLTKKMKVKDVKELYRGMKALAIKYSVNVVGGDVVRSPKNFFITLDMVGITKMPIMRSGAKPGDLLLSIGSFGGSALGLKELKRSGKKAKCATAHLMPKPMIKEASKISKYASSMIDNSDGLARCVIEICKASKVGARLYSNAIPTVKGASFNDALHGGEDYNLVFTAHKSKTKLIKGAVIIGEIVRRKGVSIIDGKGNEKILKDKGFEHF